MKAALDGERFFRAAQHLPGGSFVGYMARENFLKEIGVIDIGD